MPDKSCQGTHVNRVESIGGIEIGIGGKRWADVSNGNLRVNELLVEAVGGREEYSPVAWNRVRRRRG